MQATLALGAATMLLKQVASQEVYCCGDPGGRWVSLFSMEGLKDAGKACIRSSNVAE